MGSGGQKEENRRGHGRRRRHGVPARRAVSGGCGRGSSGSAQEEGHGGTGEPAEPGGRTDGRAGGGVRVSEGYEAGGAAGTAGGEPSVRLRTAGRAELWALGGGTASSRATGRGGRSRSPVPAVRCGAVLSSSLPAPSEGGGGSAANWGKGRRAALPAAADHALFACPRPDRAPPGAANGGGTGAGRGGGVRRGDGGARPTAAGDGGGDGGGLCGRASALPRATELPQSHAAGGSWRAAPFRAAFCQTVRVPTCRSPSCRPHGCERGCVRS